jgi:hypothetical protein
VRDLLRRRIFVLRRKTLFCCKTTFLFNNKEHVSQVRGVFTLSWCTTEEEADSFIDEEEMN